MHRRVRKLASGLNGQARTPSPEVRRRFVPKRLSRYTEISGGERQLVLIARALAQEARVLVMDEPTSNLDYGNQQRVMSQVCRLAESRSMGVILTTHDPNHALQHASRALVLDGRGRCAFGRPSAAVTEAYLRA